MTTQIEQFKRELDLSIDAKKHLEERFGSLASIEDFNLGFCPTHSSYSFDLLNGRLIVPIMDVYGNSIGFGGRRIDTYGVDVKEFYKWKTDNLSGLDKYLKWKSSKWINTPYKKSDHLFNLNKAKKSIFEKGYCFIVEGYFDAIFLDVCGFKNVVALCGTSLSPKQAELIFRYCDTVVIMLDGDDAGQIAAEKSIIKARNASLFAHIVKLPNGVDPDNLTQAELNFVEEQVQSTQEELLIEL